jgi:hypothetical protein
MMADAPRLAMPDAAMTMWKPLKRFSALESSTLSVDFTSGELKARARSPRHPCEFLGMLAEDGGRLVGQRRVDEDVALGATRAPSAA